MANIEEKNAIIKSVTIEIEDHGILTMFLHLDYGGAGQGFGGYGLYTDRNFNNGDPVGPNYCGHFIWRVLETVGVRKIEQLQGKTIRVKAEHNKVHAIGHIVEDKWFNPQEEFSKLGDEE